MIERLKILFLAWASVFLQSSVVGLAGIWGMVPDLSAVVVVWQGLTRGPLTGIQVGALCGFLADCYRPASMGLFTLSGILCGYLAGSLRERIYREQLFSQVALVSLMALLRHPFELWGRTASPWGGYPHFLIRYGLGGAVYTGIVAAVVLPWLNQWVRPRAK